MCIKKSKTIHAELNFVLFSDVYRANGITKNFQEFLTNLFQPLFEATIDPASHPDLFRFMHHLTGFDSVDDETKPEKPILTADMPYPEEWNMKDNPPYVYYLVIHNKSNFFYCNIFFYFSSICMQIFLH